MKIKLADVARCFEGEIPAMLATSSVDGVPNLGHLSQVFLVDEQHVAISNQFLTKSIRNLRENPLASVVITDPSDLVTYRLLLRYEGPETSGATFDSMSRSIDAIAALTGMSGVFGLRSAELLRVLDVDLAPAAELLDHG